jgi:hypothetical protein
MILDTIQKIKLYQLLFFIDCDLAQRLQAKGCPFCGAPLHVSNYPRKPRGGPDYIPEAFLIRHSLCCSEERCRKRALPVSCRFWNRKVYWGVVILVAMTLQQGRTNGYSAGKLQRLLGISRHTLKRWMIYFTEVFPFSKVWQRIKGRIGFSISHNDLPGAVVLFYVKQSESLETGVIQALKFLCGGFEMV